MKSTLLASQEAEKALWEAQEEANEREEAQEEAREALESDQARLERQGCQGHRAEHHQESLNRHHRRREAQNAKENSKGTHLECAPLAERSPEGKRR